MKRRASPMSHRADRLDREWRELRVHLAAGGATENQLGAMRAAFFCGAHATIAVLATGKNAADEVMAELKRDIATSQASIGRMGMH